MDEKDDSEEDDEETETDFFGVVGSDGVRLLGRRVLSSLTKLAVYNENATGERGHP